MSESECAGAVTDRVCRGRAVQKKSVRDTLVVSDSKSIANEEMLSMLALFIIELKEQMAALEYQVVRLRLQMADDAIRLPSLGLDG